MGLRLRWVRGGPGFMGNAVGPDLESPLALCGFPEAPRGSPGLLLPETHDFLSRGTGKKYSVLTCQERVRPQKWVFPRRGTKKYLVLKFSLEKRILFFLSKKLIGTGTFLFPAQGKPTFVTVPAIWEGTRGEALPPSSLLGP